MRLRQSGETVPLYRQDVFTRRKLDLVLQTINRHLSKGTGGYTVLGDDPTIEHIMPQTLTVAWKQHLGDNWQQDYELLHTLGNLTVVTKDWNSMLSNSSYHNKQQALAGHALELNKVYFGSHAPQVWNGSSIRKRAQWMITKIIEIWPQLGETATGWDERPRAVVILDEPYPVSSWRDVLRRTAEVAVQWCGDKFEDNVVAKRPGYFTRTPSGDVWHPLPNGWSVYVNLSADAVKQISAAIVEAAGIPEDEYNVELW